MHKQRCQLPNGLGKLALVGVLGLNQFLPFLPGPVVITKIGYDHTATLRDQT